MAAIPPQPSHEDMMRLVRWMRPFRWLTKPVCLGLDNIPLEGPTLFVGNHTLFGILDASILIVELYARRQIALRGLGDRIHFQVPIWGPLLERHGVVLGTRDNCGALFEQRQHVLVFPGGAREVSKRRGEKYKLIWQERVGFARMALRHQVTIVPFASIGVDDAFDILLDADDLMATPVGRIVERLGVRRDLIMPIVRGLGPTPLPRPERQYFHFGEPIHPSEFGLDDSDHDAVHRLRDRTRDAIENGIEELQRYRDDDPGRNLADRIRQ